MVDQDSDDSDSQNSPPRKRKEWLKTGNVPRSTLLRWAKQDPGPMYEENSEGDCGSSSNLNEIESESESDSSDISSSISGSNTGSQESINVEEVITFNDEVEAVDLDDHIYNEERLVLNEQANVEFHPEPLFKGSKVSCRH